MFQNLNDLIEYLKISYLSCSKNDNLFKIGSLIEKIEKNINYFPKDKISRWIGFCYGFLSYDKLSNKDFYIVNIKNDVSSEILYLINKNIIEYCLQKTKSSFLKKDISHFNEIVDKTDINYSIFVGFVQFLLINNNDMTVDEERDRTRLIFQDYYKMYELNFYNNYYLNNIKELKVND